MRPLTELPEERRRQVRCVFTDIDDTLTTDGRLRVEAYSSMATLDDAGIAVVPITGRPAGWCDLIARIWPVRGVVGENGAFYFRYDRDNRRMVRYYADSAETRAIKRRKLSAIAEAVLSRVPGSAISADQAYRETDLAIDFREDVPPLSDEKVGEILEIFETNGATAKVSSIHVNGWFGDYDKLTMTRIFAEQCLNTDLEAEPGTFAFVGDSPNDAPMFRFFPVSVGVANVKAFIDQLDPPPAYVTSAPGGAGFAEFATALLAARRAAL